MYALFKGALYITNKFCSNHVCHRSQNFMLAYLKVNGSKTIAHVQCGILKKQMVHHETNMKLADF